MRTVRQRLYSHRDFARTFPERRIPVSNWIRAQEKLGHKIEAKVLVTNAIYNKTEIQLIKKYRSLGFRLLNVTDGGEGTLGWKPSRAWRKKMSLNNTGNFWTEERKKFWSDWISKNHPMRGKKFSKESRKKMSLAKKGKPSHFKGMTDRWTPEQKKKIGIASAKRWEIRTPPWTGKKKSASHRRKLSISLTGKKLSPETRLKMSMAHKARRERLGSDG